MRLILSGRCAPGARVPRALVCALAASSLLSCSVKSVSGFSWRDRSGSSLSFSQSASRPEGREGDFSSEDKEDRYSLGSSLSLDSGESLVVGVRREAGSGGTARVGFGLSANADGSSPFSSPSFPLVAESTRIALPFSSKASLGSLAVTAKQGAFAIEYIRVDRAFRGIDKRSPELRVSSDFSLATSKSGTDLAIEKPFAGLAPRSSGEGESRPGLLLAYGPAPLGSALRIRAQLPGGQEREYRLRCRPMGATTVLDSSLLGADAVSVALSAPPGVEVAAFYATELPRADYELADLGRVLSSDAPADPYALYRWDMLPSVLIFDFKDYATQDRYLKRLAFFVEKIGYHGVLAKDEEIAPLHGWNAHDYRAEDLAAFFEAARSKSFPLNEAEKELESTLLASGIIKSEGGKIASGSGALISISRETAGQLRWTLAVHESTHAILFMDPDYRKFAQDLWTSLDAGEKWFWKTYLTWALYDTSSSYLISNEFQAYLMQQPTKMARDYFEKRKSAELLEKHPELQAKVDEYFARYGDSFTLRASALESWLYKKYAVQAGRTVFLTRTRP
jgi:hypothetical protein